LPWRDWIFHYYGIDISAISKFPEEEEVLLYPGTQYGVYNVSIENSDRLENGKMVIHLRVLSYDKNKSVDLKFKKEVEEH